MNGRPASPRVIAAGEVEALLDYPSLVEALHRAFLDPPLSPDRMSLPLGQEGTADRLLLMPAVRRGRLAVIKIVTVHPDRPASAGGAVRATLVAIDAATGAVSAWIDGHSLTLRRTAAASVLAARLLARADSRRLAILGAGAVAGALAEAYAASFEFDDIAIWARRGEAAAALADRLARAGLPARAAPDRADMIAGADIVSAATLSTAPLILVDEVRPGTHVDLVGGFTPAMREADDALVGRSLVVADGAAALREAGDLAGPIAAGRLAADRVRLLGDVLRHPPERDPGAITLFKSVGLALEDLAAAELLLDKLDRKEPWR